MRSRPARNCRLRRRTSGRKAGAVTAVYYGQRCSADERVAVEGAALVSGHEAAHLLARQQGADRHPAAQALAERHDVGPDAGMAVAPQLAGAADAGLHLVEHEQQAAFVAQARSARRNSGSASMTPASPWIVSSITATVCGPISASTAGDVVQARFRKPGTCGAKRRSKPGLPLALIVARVRPWKAVFEGDDLERAAAMHLAELACELDRALVGLGAAVGEEAALQPARGSSGATRARLPARCRSQARCAPGAAPAPPAPR
jgi:hypothetical protein